MNQENTSAPAENKMGTMPIGKLLFNMSLPMMISMLVQADSDTIHYSMFRPMERLWRNYHWKRRTRSATVAGL